MANIEGIFDSVFGVLHQITEAIRGMIGSLSPEYKSLILLGLAGVGGFYLGKKFPNIKQSMVMVVYGVILFLILKFV